MKSRNIFIILTIIILITIGIILFFLSGRDGEPDSIPSVVTVESPLISPISPIPTPTSLATETTEVMEATDTPVPSPTPTEVAGPPPLTDPFVLDEPIKVGDTMVSGHGPPNIPIKIFEVAQTADLLGETITADDGSFSIEFPDRPLRMNERVGVIAGDLSETPYVEEDFKPIAIRAVPTYGYILADVSVQP